MIDAEYLRLHFSYDPASGAMTRLSNGKPAAFKMANGYAAASIKSRHYYIHRLAWLYMTGEWPEVVDHINRDKMDNRWENLRSVTQAQNCANAPASRNNKCGVKGASFDRRKKRWRATIMVDRKQRFLGYFSTSEEAGRAYAEAAKSVWGDCAHAG